MFLKFAIDNRLGFCYNQYRVKCSADIAQLAEHVIGNDEVMSSNLIISSKSSPYGLLFAFVVQISYNFVRNCRICAAKGHIFPGAADKPPQYVAERRHIDTNIGAYVQIRPFRPKLQVQYL